MTSAMTCRDVVALLTDYAEGRLTARRQLFVDGHLAGCPLCRGFVASYREAPRILRDATTCAPPRSVARRLRRLVQGLSSRRRAAPGSRRH